MLTVGELMLWVVYFISLYFTIFWLIVFLENEERLIEQKKTSRPFPKVTITIPAYNEEATIRKTIDSCLALDYPEELLEIMVVNDGSKDGTKRVVEKAIAENKTKKKIILINQKNSGKAAAMNKAIGLSQSELFVCLDADSFVAPDALKKIVPEFDDSRIAIALPLMKASRPNNLLQKMQFTEYLVNIFYKKLMSFLDCIHVAPGPFSVYRREALIKVGGYDEKSITEDLEIAVRMQKHGYRIVQNMDAVVYTNTPDSFKEYYSQRNRWFKGGVLTAWKHKDMFFNTKYGDFGLIQFPILIVSGILSLSLIGSLVYYSVKPVIEYINNMGLVGFDLWTFIRTIDLKINLYNANFINLSIFLFTIAISLYFLYISYIYTKETVSKEFRFALPAFLFVYFFISGITWIGVIRDLIIGRKNNW